MIPVSNFKKEDFPNPIYLLLFKKPFLSVS